MSLPSAYRSRQVLVVTLAAAALTACSGQSPASPSRSQSVAPGSLERRVDALPGGGATIDQSVVLLLETANGDTLSALCDLQRETPLVVEGCSEFDGTGRLEGATAYFRRMRFELLDETRLTLRSQLQIPTMGNQVYQVNGELSASVSVESGSNCLELVRVDFTGHLEQLGRVRGALSYCAS